MSDKKQTSGLDRRGFLKTLGGGAGAAAIGAAVVAPAPAAAAESEAEKKKARYTLSKHVEAYYRTNRY